MNYSPTILAQAFLKALEETNPEKHTALRKNFLKTIKWHGLAAQANKILEEVERLYMKKTGAHKVVLETARPISKNLFGSLEKLFGKKDKIIKKNNPEIVAGIKITIDDETVLDQSLKRKLEKLFRH